MFSYRYELSHRGVKSRPPHRVIRLSAMLYNGLDQYHRLADALVDELRGA